MWPLSQLGSLSQRFSGSIGTESAGVLLLPEKVLIKTIRAVTVLQGGYGIMKKLILALKYCRGKD